VREEVCGPGATSESTPHAHCFRAIRKAGPLRAAVAPLNPIPLRAAQAVTRVRYHVDSATRPVGAPRLHVRAWRSVTSEIRRSRWGHDAL